MSTEKSDLKYDCTASSPFKYHLNTKHENPFDHLFARSFRFARSIQCLMSLGYFLDLIWWLLYSKVCRKRTGLPPRKFVFSLSSLLFKKFTHQSFPAPPLPPSSSPSLSLPRNATYKKKDTINKKNSKSTTEIISFDTTNI